MQSSPGTENAGIGQSGVAARPRGSLRANAALVGIAILIALVVCEVGFRIVTGVPLLKFVNWRKERVAADRLREFKAIPDPVLGWVSRPFSVHRDGYTTIAHGIRQNFGETEIRTGAVLAVGDSFTEGWEVKDHESWPALLEKRIGKPVVNGGVGAYGTDQIVLRAEQLLPIVKPRTLIVGFLEEDIFRAEHSVFGAPKPYFTLEKGELQYHPPPPYEAARPGTAFSSFVLGLRDVLGYSAAAHYFFARLNPKYWYGSGTRDEYRKAGVDPAAVTCALLRRLKAETDREGIRMILFMQYYAPQIIEADAPSENARRVVACAGAAGIRVIDQFASLHALERATPNALAAYYFAHDGELVGHMTLKGNEHAAAMLEEAWRE
ncbi:MAG TPA: hypothetical protein VIF14_15895 [Alphaproteobacteria bacterium]|jgi:hypothetical protein